MKDRRVSSCASAVAKVNWRAAWFGVAFAAVVGFSSVANAADAGNWIGSWTSSPQPAWGADFPVPLGIPANLWKQTDPPDGAPEHRRRPRAHRPFE